MTRDWRKVALAVVAASAFASVCAQDWQAAAQQPNRPGKAGKSKQQANGDSDEGDKGAAKKKRQDPADAQRAVESAAKLLQSGKADQAEHTLSATLAAGSLPPAIMARALYLRGMAYREQKKPAQAISDLTSALWLKGGLTADDRADALKQRSAAYSDAGLTETGALASPSPAGEPSRPSAAKSWGTVTTPTSGAAPSTPQTSDAGGNWFKNWFGAWSPGGQTSPPPATTTSPPTASIEKAESAPARPSQTARISTAWSSKTEVRAAEAPVTTSAPTTGAAKSSGKYRVQLATVRSQREAEAVATKAKQALGALAQDAEIDQAVLGNMGSFYRVRVGPFATMQEAQAVCAKVKGSGFDCLAVSQ